MRNGANIHDLNSVEASTSQLPLIGFTVLWRLAGIRVSHSQMVREIIDGMNAVSLRQAGGVYFVPESERDSL